MKNEVVVKHGGQFFLVTWNISGEGIKVILLSEEKEVNGNLKKVVLLENKKRISVAMNGTG